jgi:hypothetical protein
MWQHTKNCEIDRNPSRSQAILGIRLIRAQAMTFYYEIGLVVVWHTNNRL